jgi:CheY-like chemotaxis protein
VRVVIAEDLLLLREGLVKVLEGADFAVVGQAGDADGLLLKVRSYKPDVAIIDVRMPPTQTDESAGGGGDPVEVPGGRRAAALPGGLGAACAPALFRAARGLWLPAQRSRTPGR